MQTARRTTTSVAVRRQQEITFSGHGFDGFVCRGRTRVRFVPQVVHAATMAYLEKLRRLLQQKICVEFAVRQKTDHFAFTVVITKLVGYASPAGLC